MLRIDKQMTRRLTRMCGRKERCVTRFHVSFDLHTPKDYPHQPWDDEAMLIDLLDAIQNHAMAFHDIPGFQLQGVQVAGEWVIGPSNSLTFFQDYATKNEITAALKEYRDRALACFTHDESWIEGFNRLERMPLFPTPKPKRKVKK